MNKPIRVLHIMNGAVAGGISTVVLSYCRMIDRDKIHFDCAVTNTEIGQNGIALKTLGCEMIDLPLKSHNPLRYILRLRGILRNGKYDAVHVHSNLTSYYPLMIARFSRVPLRIAHAHTAMPCTSFRARVKRAISIALMPHAATQMVACSQAAAVAIFGKKSAKSARCMVIGNAIDTKRFAFDSVARDTIRKALSLQDKFVIGCVGALSPEKNTSYALRIIDALNRQSANAYHLLLVGDGALRARLEDEARELGIERLVSFLGVRSDVPTLLQGMDAFLMPSKYEGFLIAGIEAAASGLPLFLSDRIPDVFSFYSHYQYLSIDEKPTVWADNIMGTERVENRTEGLNEVVRAGYDLSSIAGLLNDLYCGGKRQ